MTDGGDSYLLNLGIQGNEALETLRAILAQMRETNRTGREMVTHLDAISQSMRAMAEATAAATNAIRSEGTATREAIVAHQGRAAAIEMETRRIVQAEQATLRYQSAARGPVGSSDPLMMGTSGYDQRQATLAAQQARLLGLTVGSVGGAPGQGGTPTDPLTMMPRVTSAITDQTKALADNNRGWMRHLSWFVQGTVIYMGLNAAINAVRSSIRDLNEVTEVQSRAQAEMALSMEMSTAAYRQQQALTRGGLQRLGVGAVGAAGLYTEAGRVSDTPEELRGFVGAGAMLSSLTGQPATESIDTLRDILHQYNMEGSEAIRVTDAIAYSARVGSDTMEDYAIAFSKSGAALRTAGYDFEESVGLILGMTGAVERSGAELGTFVQQVFTLNEAEINRLREAGIEPSGRSVRSVFQQAAQMFPGASQQQQQLILSAFGGTRFQSDVRAIMEGYSGINSAVQDAANLQGEAARRADEMGNTVTRAGERATAAWQNYLDLLSKIVNWEQQRIGVSRQMERAFSAPVAVDMWRGLNESQRAEASRRIRAEVGIGSRATGYVETGLGLGTPDQQLFSRMTIDELLTALQILTEVMRSSAIQQEMASPEMASIRVRNQMMGRGPYRDRGGAEDLLRPLNLLSAERFSAVEARALQEGINEIDKRLISLGFEPGDTGATRQVLVGEGQNFQLETIAGSSVAMEMHLRELRDRSRQLSGVWNLPGQAMVPLESLDFMMSGGGAVSQAQQYQSFIPDMSPAMPSVVPTRGETDLRSTIETVLQGFLPMLMKDRVNNTVENIRIPLIMKGEKMAEAVAQVQGDSFQRSVVAGSKFGGNLPPSVIGSW